MICLNLGRLWMASSYTVPTNVGIKAIELYFPKCYIDQEEFAKVVFPI